MSIRIPITNCATLHLRMKYLHIQKKPPTNEHITNTTYIPTSDCINLTFNYTAETVYCIQFVWTVFSAVDWLIAFVYLV